MGNSNKITTFAKRKCNATMRYLYIICLVLAAVSFYGCGKEDIVVTETKDITNQDDDDTKESVDSNYTYKLPVVFHVLYTTYNDSVRALAAYLPVVLGYVNELYRGNIYGWHGTYSENINIDLQPATTDEEGHRLDTPGVVFEKWEGKFPIEANSFMSSKNKQYIWEPNEYVNVVVFPFEQKTAGSIILGISHMPYTLNDSTELEGLEPTNKRYLTKKNIRFPYCLAINSDYVHSMSTRYTDTDSTGRRTYGRKGYLYTTSDIVATLAHELGHYLGLHHVFTEEKKSGKDSSGWTEVDDCYDTDYCDDTPSYNKVAYDDSLHTAEKGTNIQKYMKRQSCDGREYDSYNIMDYSLGYAFQLTADQKMRIRHVLYYSPLIPGPKLNHVNTITTRSAESDSIINLPIVTSE